MEKEPITVIGKAKQLIENHGKDFAIKFFQDRIEAIGEPKNFQDICNISGNKTAIDFINNQPNTEQNEPK